MLTWKLAKKKEMNMATKTIVNTVPQIQIPVVVRRIGRSGALFVGGQRLSAIRLPAILI